MMLRSKKALRTLLLAVLVVGALALSGCHMIGAHGSLYLGGHHGGHGRHQTGPSYGHQHQRPRPSRHSHSTGRHYRH